MAHQTLIAFPARLEAQPEGGFTVTFRDIPEAITQGDDEAEALRQAADALAEALAGRIAGNERIPEPTPQRRGERLVTPEEPLALKTALYEVMRAEGLTKSALAARLGFDEKEVRRMLDPRHATQEARLRDALAQLGVETRSVVIDTSPMRRIFRAPSEDRPAHRVVPGRAVAMKRGARHPAKGRSVENGSAPGRIPAAGPERRKKA